MQNDASPELLLFLSVDVVGSTAFKHYQERSNSDVQPWLPVFLSFYQNFTQNFSQEYPEKSENTSENTPVAWKSLGDELIFVIPLRDHKETNQHIARFKAAIQNYRREFKRNQLKLDLKGTAWSLGFR